MQLIDSFKDKQFQESGFLKFDNFLDTEQLLQLKEFYKNSKLGDTNGGLYTNIQDLSYDESLLIENEIVRICEKSIKKYLQHYKIVGATFLLKGIGDKSESMLHQDWSIVDEKKYRSALIWIPLVDVDENNGCLQVIPNSHHWFYSIRSSSVKSIFLKLNYLVNPFLKALPMKQGAAAIFYMKLFHGSKTNNTNAVRPAITLTVIDEKADFNLYVKNKNNDIDVIHCDRKFLYNYAFNFQEIASQQNVELNVIRTIPESTKYIVTKEMLLNKIYTEKINRFTGSLLAKIVSWFNKF